MDDITGAEWLSHCSII